jgi:hypothetical protein
VLTDEGVEVADQVRVATAREFGVDQVFAGGLQQLIPAVDLAVGKPLPGHVDEGWPAPKRQCRAKQFPRVMGVTAGQLGTPAGGEVLERLGVELAWADPRHVAAGAADDRQAVRRELPQRRGVDVEGVRCGLRSVLSPQRLDERVGRHELSRPDREGGEHGSGVAPERRYRVWREDIDRTQQPDHHGSARVGGVGAA